MRKVFLIDVSGKEDFARAYEFIKKFENGTKITNLDEWQSTNVSFLYYGEKESKVNSRYMNESKRIIAFCEKNHNKITYLRSSPNSSISKDDLFYFRVTVSNDNDIVTLHYYFLMNEELKNNCMMGIIVEKDNSSTFVTERMISSFLVCEKSNFKKNQVKYKIINASNENKNKYKYKICLLPAHEEKIFFLRKPTNSKYLSPCEMDDKGISVSRLFFPLLRIKNPDVYLTLASNAKDIFDNSIFSTQRNKLFYNDLLYKMASYNNEIDWDVSDDLEKICKEGKELFLDTSNFLNEILKAYAHNCFVNICKGMTREERGKIKSYVSTAIEETSALAICIFLSFLNFIKEEATSFNFDALLMDAEDYADGLLQLIENVVKHAKNGVFCFRIHKSTLSESVSENYLKKYNISLEDGTYYLEALVSDYNPDFDITKKFAENLKKDCYNQPNEREYDISKELINKIEKKFVLADLFDYENNTETKSIWNEFYKSSRNLTSHYGLLIFERLVNFSHGIFNVVSSNKFLVNSDSIYLSKKAEKNSLYNIHIPGTQYEIVLPIDVSHKVEDTGLNYTLKTGDVAKQWNCHWVNKNIFNSDILYNYSSGNKTLYRPYYKNKAVSTFSHTIVNDFLSFEVNDYDSAIICFDVEGVVSPIVSEIISKAFISVLCDSRINSIRFFAFKNASEQFMNTFIRIFSLLYIKTGQNQLMKNRQVYICSNMEQKEILFYGEYLLESLVASKNITLLGRGEPTREFRFLERQAEKANERISQDKLVLSPLPFEVIVDGVFKERVKADLERNIQKSEFGCCLQDVHMRVGTKIHTHGNYYEASLLFSNSNYVSRFAFFICEKLLKRIKYELDDINTKKIVLIGYEAYSESLMIQLKNDLELHLLKDNNYSIDYMIYYENIREQPFLRWNQVQPNENTKFIVIVPIGSTLTTHDKIVADLCRQKIDENKYFTTESIFDHFALVLIRNSQVGKTKNGCREIEDVFWESIHEDDDNKESFVVYKSNNIGASNKINFFISVENEWQLPNECKYCFPPINKLALEEPLIQSNRSSVVPMTMYGIEHETVLLENVSSYEEDELRLLPLKTGLCYGHVIRNQKNHFKYYFKTDAVMEAVLKTQKDLFDKWLTDEVGNLFDNSSNSKIVFNFIVAPLHKTNAQFVHKINGSINTKQIIWLDTSREYRDNVKAKYSNLTTLVKNLINANENEEIHIHFHFVDDTITSGFTINRSKDLLKSLFYDIQHSNERVKIHLFSSVILLLNRCSNSTKQNYVTKERFKSYFNLNVSVMRSHSDACVPCKLHNDYSELLKKGAATNMTSGMANEYAKVFKPTDESAFKIDCKDEDSNNELGFNKNHNREYNFNQLIANHRLNTIFHSLGGQKNNKKSIEHRILNELNSICNLFENDNTKFEIVYDRVVAVLEVASRPFLIYRHSVYKAITKILIELFNYILLKSPKTIFQRKSLSSINKFLSYMMVDKSENSKKFVLLLLDCLSSVNSTVLVRPIAINAFLEFFKKGKFDVDELCREYVLCVKKLIDLSGKENLSSWFEKVLEKGFEPYPKTSSSPSIIHSEEYEQLLNLLRIENTLPVRTALEECNKAFNHNHISDSLFISEHEDGKLLSIVEDTLKQYYCKSYRDFVNIEVDDDMYRKHCKEVFLPMFKLYKYLITNSQFNTKTYYDFFLTLVKKILRTNSAVIMIQTDSNINRLYPGRFSAESIIHDELEQRAEKTIRDKDRAKWLGDTYAIDKTDGSCIGILKLVHTYKQDDEKKLPIWYIAFDIECNSETKEQKLINRVRNLLSMRWIMAERLNEDFNNNIIGEFLNYKDQFKKLGTDKSGSHTPYSELSDAFYGIRNKIPQNWNNNIDDMYIIANQYKLIADSVISKWYVHSVLKTFPENMSPNEVKLDHPKRASLYSDVLLISKFASANNEGANVYCDLTKDWNIPWDKVRFTAPYHCDFMWCAAFQSLIFNALHHGYNYEIGENKNVVDISVEYKNNYIIIRNRMKDGDEIASNSVTLTALKYFFDNYYGNESFSFTKIIENGQPFFQATLPCLKEEKTNENIYY